VAGIRGLYQIEGFNKFVEHFKENLMSVVKNEQFLVNNNLDNFVNP